jgi:glycine oxidase
MALCSPLLPTATEDHALPAAASSTDLHADVIVAGAGVIGLSIAWRAGRTLRVVVVDPAPGGGASDVAAGMLAPVSELTYGEEALSRLTLESAARYPAFVEELHAVTGMVVGYRRSATLSIALDRDDLAAVDEIHRFLIAHQMPVERLSGHDARRREPLLSPDLHGALLVPGDHQVDPRLLLAALRRACQLGGVREISSRVVDLFLEDGRITGVRLDDGTRLRSRHVVVAAGAHSAGIVAGVEELPVRPVKGQLLVLRTSDGLPFLQGTVRGLAHGSSVYLVPRSDGRVVVGGTVEERGFDTAVTADALYTLLRDARRLVPGITELEFVEARAALRPGTPDNAPILGGGETPGLIFATGHYRNGVLLTPVTADVIEALLLHGELPEAARPFVNARFARGKVKR